MLHLSTGNFSNSDDYLVNNTAAFAGLNSIRGIIVNFNYSTGMIETQLFTNKNNNNKKRIINI
jgi:hypothetical protein